MNVQLPIHMDQRAFLAWVESQEERYELDRGRVIMMTGGSRAHWQITANLLRAIELRLDLDRFAVLPEFGVRPNAGSIRFSDIVVDLAGQPPKDQTATAPVLSPRSFRHRPSASISATRLQSTCSCRVSSPMWSSPKMR